MENDDVLLQISKLEGNALVKVNFHGADDMIKVATIIASLCEDNPEFGLVLLFTMKAFRENPEFVNKVLESKEQIPDFNEILKSENNE